MNKRALWRRIVGRVKSNMVTIMMGLIAILLPVGSAFFILAYQAIDAGNKSGSIIYMVLAVIIWGAGIYVWRELKKSYQIEKQEEAEKFNEQINELRNVRLDINNSLEGFTKAINELINEIRQERNERRSDTKH